MRRRRLEPEGDWSARVGSGLDFAVVVGNGRLGALVAGKLSAAGANVVVVDRSREAFARLPPEFCGRMLEGDAVEPATLRAAETGRADLVVAATDDDDVNLMVAQAAREIHGVGLVVARIYEPATEPVFRELGITTVSPTRLTAEAIEVILSADRERRARSK